MRQRRGSRLGAGSTRHERPGRWGVRGVRGERGSNNKTQLLHVGHPSDPTAPALAVVAPHPERTPPRPGPGQIARRRAISVMISASYRLLSPGGGSRETGGRGSRPGKHDRRHKPHRSLYRGASTHVPGRSSQTISRTRFTIRITRRLPTRSEGKFKLRSRYVRSTTPGVHRRRLLHTSRRAACTDVHDGRR